MDASQQVDNNWNMLSYLPDNNLDWLSYLQKEIPDDFALNYPVDLSNVEIKNDLKLNITSNNFNHKMDMDEEPPTPSELEVYLPSNSQFNGFYDLPDKNLLDKDKAQLTFSPFFGEQSNVLELNESMLQSSIISENNGYTSEGNLFPYNMSEYITSHQQHTFTQGNLVNEANLDEMNGQNIIGRNLPTLNYQELPNDQVNEVLDDNKTLLQMSIEKSNLKVFEELLLNKDIDLLAKDINGNTFLHLIVKNHQAASFLIALHKKKHLEHVQMAINNSLCEKDVKGESVIHILTRKGNIQLIHLMLEISGSRSKSLINLQESRDCKTPLILASDAEDWELCKYLLSVGADINIGNLAGKTPIHYACSAGEKTMVKYFYEHGAKPNQRLATGGNEKTMTNDPEIKEIVDCAMKNARNIRAKDKRRKKKMNGNHQC